MELTQAQGAALMAHMDLINVMQHYQTKITWLKRRSELDIQDADALLKMKPLEMGADDIECMWAILHHMTKHVKSVLSWKYED